MVRDSQPVTGATHYQTCLSNLRFHHICLRVCGLNLKVWPRLTKIKHVWYYVVEHDVFHIHLTVCGVIWSNILSWAKPGHRCSNQTCKLSNDDDDGDDDVYGVEFRDEMDDHDSQSLRIKSRWARSSSISATAWLIFGWGSSHPSSLINVAVPYGLWCRCFELNSFFVML